MYQQKVKLVIGLILVIIFAGLDYQCFSEGMGRIVSPAVRQAGHILILIPVALCGAWAWKAQPQAWAARIWNISYTGLFILLLLTGGLQWKFKAFPDTFLDQVRMLRLLFCSPLVYLFLLMLVRFVPVREQPADEMA